MTTESTDFSKSDVPTAEKVMKICLIVSIAIGGLLVVLALAGHRSILEVGSGVIVLVSLQWSFYMMARAKRISGKS